MSNIITQVSEYNQSVNPMDNGVEDDYNTIINLNIRNHSFQITREELMSLPESILLCLFPNGVFLDENNQVITNLTEHHVVYVDFSPVCFKYIIDTFSKTAASAINNAGNNNNFHDQNDLTDSYILESKPCIIVLREDLDFYCIPPKVGLSSTQMKDLKSLVGSHLVKNKKIFDGLGYKPNKQLGPAEQHLLDMLCNAGYNVNDSWGFRDVEPGKAVVCSLALVQLKKEHTNSDSNSKLLLFWKKPARKCWWSQTVINVNIKSVLPDFAGDANASIKVHIRRVWTLELAVLYI